MPDESISHLAQSRTFQISPTSGNVVEVDPFGEASSMDLLTDKVIDSKYKIMELLGEGGMGAVYRAHHLMLGKDIALKTFRSSTQSVQAIERFNREVRTVAKLASANVVQVFDSGITESNQPYYTMELLLGQSLQDKLSADGALSLEEALRIFTDVAEGMRSAHNSGIVHRDLKPANIFLSAGEKGKRPSVKVVDFGIAKLADNSMQSQYQTSAGAIFGSPLYMSPEQSRGDEVDGRSDIYSFGCTFFESLTGRPPLVGNHALETMILHQTKVPPRLSERSPAKTFPPVLESFVARLLHKSPEHRPQTFDDVIEAFQRIGKLIRTDGAASSSTSISVVEKNSTNENEPPSIFRQPIFIAIMVLLIVGLGVGSYFLLSPTPVKRDITPVVIENLPPAKPSKNGVDEQADANATELLTGVGNNVALLQTPAGPLPVAGAQKEYEVFNKILNAENFAQLTTSKIESLNLHRCKFDNKDLAALRRLKLVSLTLSITNCDDTGIAALVGSDNLIKLSIDGTLLTDAACKSLAKLKSLKFLEISRTAVTDKGLQSLAMSRSLGEVRLNNTGITAKGLTKLFEGCHTVGSVQVAGCRNLSEADLKMLDSKFPGMKIAREDPTMKRNDANSYFQKPSRRTGS